MIFLILLLPSIFQIVFGIKAHKGTISLRFWQISLISLLLQVLSAVCDLFLISELISRSGSRHGLPFIGMLILEVMAGGILLVIILIQGYIQFRKNKSLNEYGNAQKN